MADSETVDTTQQVTSKNPKRVAALKKAMAEVNAIIANNQRRRAETPAKNVLTTREAQKKAIAEINAIIANNQLRRAETPADTPPAYPAKNVLTTTQWLNVIGLVVSLAGIKGLLTPHPSRDGVDEVDNAEQSSAISE